MKSLKWLTLLIMMFGCFLIIKDLVYSTPPVSEELDVIPLEGDPRNIAIDPYTNQAIVISIRPNELSVIDLDSKQISATIPIRKAACGLAVDFGLNLALVTHKAGHRLSLVDLKTHQIRADLSVGKSPCNAAVYEAENGLHLGLTANYRSNTVSVIDLQSLRVIKTIPVGRGPRDIAVDPGLKKALVVNEDSHNAAIIDLTTLRVTDWIAVGRHPRAVSINPETHLAAVANGKERFITTINLGNGQTQVIGVDKNPGDVVINPLDNRLLVVSNNSHRLQLIDPDTRTTLQRYPLPKKTRGVAVNPFTNMAAVVDDKTDSLTLIQLPNPVPEITALVPEILSRGSQETRLRIEGSGFIKTSVLSFQPSPAIPLEVEFIDNHHLEVTLPASFLAQAGSYQVTVHNPAPEGGTSNAKTFQVGNPVPTITSLDPASAPAGGSGLTLTVYGSGFFPETTIFFGDGSKSITCVNSNELKVTLTPADLAAAGSMEIRAFNPGPGGGTSNAMNLILLNPPPVLASISPNTVKAGSPGFTMTLIGSGFVNSATVTFNNAPVPTTYINSTQLEVAIPAGSLLTAGSYPVTVSNPGPGGGSSGSLAFTVTPASNVPPLPEGSYGKTYEDLIPPNATLPGYDPKRFSLITGLANDLAGNPLAGVLVGIHNRPEYGTALTDGSGRFSLPVDGGGTTTVTYQKPGFITAHRQVTIGWNTIATAETVVLVTEDTAATVMTFDGNPATILTHRSTPTSDTFGSRSLTMVLTGDNKAYVKDAQGIEQPLTQITVRATEYPTPESMPAKLPPTSAFTYCAELGVDGARSVRFEKPVVVFVDNFLGFDVGEIVPVGYYDRDRAVWVPANNGVVVRLLDTNGDGVVDSFTDGKNQYPALGLTDTNRFNPGATYWRFETTHFSPWDCNWPVGFPRGATSPNPKGKPNTDKPCPADDCSRNGSYVENRSRILHEDIPVPGSDLILHYGSHRTKGYKSVITIPVSGDSVPASLRKIIAKIEVAGQSLETDLPPLPNQLAEFVWDGLDYLGREVSGSTVANISIGFVYQAVYYSAFDSSWSQSFALVGTNPTYVEAREEAISWKRDSLILSRGVSGAGNFAAGWSLSVHHYLDPTDLSTLYKGDGSTIQNNALTIRTLAGNGQQGFSGDGGPATQAAMYYPTNLAMDRLGNMYLADSWNNRIRKVDTGGIITTIAGNGQEGFLGDGGPATQALLNRPTGIAVDQMGNVFIADSGNYRVRKIDRNGIIATIAGGGSLGSGVPALQASIGIPINVALDRSGNIFIAETGYYRRVWKVDPNGIIYIFAGNGQKGYSGEGGQALQAALSPVGLAVDRDGNLFISSVVVENADMRVVKVDNSGIITTVAGTGIPSYGGDGGTATQAGINYPQGIAVDESGNLYIADTGNLRIRKVNSQGIITTIAGNGTGSNQMDLFKENGLATENSIFDPRGVLLDSRDNVYIVQMENGRVLKSALPEGIKSSMNSTDIAFSDENGQGYIMDQTGLHKSTIDLISGKTLLSFGYDQAHKLVSITDRFGNLTTLQRNGSGAPISITSPDGLVTRLTADGNNHLTGVIYPDQSSYTFTYTVDGLLTGKIDPRGSRFGHQFDSNGRITNVSDPEGGFWNYTRNVDSSGTAVITMETAESNTTTYQDRTDSTGGYSTTKTDPSGSVSIFTRSTDGLLETAQPSCGMNQTMKYDLDPANTFKYLKERSQRSPAGLIQTTTVSHSYQDTNGDSVPDLINKTLTVNGKNWGSVNNTLTGALTSTSPVGRTITSKYDPSNLLTSRRTISGLYDTLYRYDNKGRITSLTRNTRVSNFTYNPQGFLASMTDPENKTIAYNYDTMGRIIRLDGPTSYSLNFSYDQNGNMTILANPSQINHSFGYNKVNLNNSYQTPISGSYRYLYDKERNLIRVTFPSGMMINNVFQNARLIRTETPEGNIVFNYLCSSKIGNITRGTEGLTYTYDGSLISSEGLRGSLNQSLTYTYNNDFRLSSFTYAGQTVSYSYDNDTLLTGAGSFTIGRNASDGLPISVNDGTLNLTRTFNGYGEEDGEKYVLNSQTPLSWSMSRTNTGRISSRTETVDGTITHYSYTYDPMGRLLTVSRDDSVVEQYQYNSNGTRNYEMNTLRGIAGRTLTYSIEDHLLTAGNTSYQYNRDGFLTTKTQGTIATNYTYSSQGELLSVQLPDGRTIEYLHDPLARRIAKKVNGNITEKYLWQGRTRLLAVYDGNDNLQMRFNYADGRMPLSIMKDGLTYYLMYDQIGSLKAVADSAGNVIKRIDYDSFGNITIDTNPSFTIPLGFAGGIYDKDTGLVRFGYRDYNPEIGRWTAKDPIQFRGGDMDLFAYVQSNPVNWVDPNGLACGPGIIGDLSIFDNPGGNDFSYCCSMHDICYKDCKKSREHCNTEFRECMGKVCQNSSNPSCDFFKNLFSGLVGGIGGALSYHGDQGLGNYPGQKNYQGIPPIFYFQF